MVSDKELEIICNERFYYQDGVLFYKVNRGSRAKKDETAGSINWNGYIHIRINGTLYLAHRIIFLIHHHYLPKFIDHIDRNPSNNNINNLRGASKKLNAINTGLPSNNTSGIKGVSWSKPASNWEAYIKNDGVKIYLGLYENIEEAAAARKIAEERYWDDLR